MLPCLMIAKHNPPISSFPRRFSLPGLYPGQVEASSFSNPSPVDFDLSTLSPFNFKPSTLNPVTFLDAASSVSPLSAALTKNTQGGGIPSSACVFRPGPLQTALSGSLPRYLLAASFLQSSSASPRSLREQNLLSSPHPITTHSPESTIPFKMCSSTKQPRNPFRMRSFKTKDLKLFRMCSFKKTGGILCLQEFLLAVFLLSAISCQLWAFWIPASVRLSTFDFQPATFSGATKCAAAPQLRNQKIGRILWT
jgi:hypothetical protein